MRNNQQQPTCPHHDRFSQHTGQIGCVRTTVSTAVPTNGFTSIHTPGAYDAFTTPGAGYRGINNAATRAAVAYSTTGLCRGFSGKSLVTVRHCGSAEIRYNSAHCKHAPSPRTRIGPITPEESIMVAGITSSHLPNLRQMLLPYPTLPTGITSNSLGIWARNRSSDSPRRGCRTTTPSSPNRRITVAASEHLPITATTICSNGTNTP